MEIETIEESAEALPEYARIPIAFTVRSRYRVEPISGGLGGLTLVEEAVVPYLKDYDAIPGEGPRHWQALWDLSNWGIMSAFDGPERVGGTVVAWNTAGFGDMEKRVDVATLLDLRVVPEHRGCGIGRMLFDRAIDWARGRECRRLKIETQNINVPACRFYARQGCVLGAINPCAYGPDLDEVQLLWFLNLS